MSIQIKDSPKDKIIFPIKVEESNEAYAYIFGADNIKLARYSTYRIISNKEITDAFSFSIDNTDLASIIEEKENEIVIKANDRNKLGSFTLRAKNADKETEYAEQVLNQDGSTLQDLLNFKPEDGEIDTEDDESATQLKFADTDEVTSTEEH